MRYGNVEIKKQTQIDVEKIYRKSRVGRWRQWVLKAYKYRIYPNSEQRIQIAKTFGCCRFVYNQTLAYRKEIYEKEKKSVSKTDCNNYCNRELKKDYEWLKEIDKFALTNAIYNWTLHIKNSLRSMQDIRNSRANTITINHTQQTSQMEILR